MIQNGISTLAPLLFLSEMLLEMKSISLLIKRVGQGLEVDREIYSIRARRSNSTDRLFKFQSPALYSVIRVVVLVVLLLEGQIYL